MKKLALLSAVAIAMLLLGCTQDDKDSRKVVAEKVDTYKANLPPVPSIPKPTAPEAYPDGSHSVYGVRKQILKTIETQVTVTAYIANVYKKPECEEGKACFTLMPHLFLADEKAENIEKRLLRVVGYAKSFKEMDDQKEKDEKGIKDELPEGVYLPPVIWDWREGQKYKITGRFTRQSGDGFMATDGLLEYEKHECLDCPPEEAKK
ncbi:MAG: hypothetical protein MUC50_02885 [Myxococcota bacterium]|nr:hypothetical protein [Myxococcota bacterium]